METVTDLIFLGSKITADSDCSHEIKRHLLLRRKAMTNLSSVQFSHSDVSDCLGPHGLQHARLPCPSLSPGLCSNSCPLSWWCHSTISSSVNAFFSCPQSFPASGSFTIHQLFTSSGQSIRVSASVSTLPVRVDLVLDTLVWAPCSPRDTQESSPAPQFESINSLSHSLLYGPTLTSIHEYWKNHNFG